MRLWLTAAAVMTVLLVPAMAPAVSVEGNHYPDTVTVEGKKLKLVGAGLREKFFFDVYSMGAYSVDGSCRPSSIITTDAPKYLRIDMLRDVSAEKMATTIGESFSEHMPKNAPAKLKQQRKTFESYFKEECKEKTVLEFIYIPGTGTLMKQNGKQLGKPLEGVVFMRVLWDIYFGKDTCCDDLKEQILETCKKK